jgi:hypothetical protein
MNLSKYFTLQEMVQSDTAVRAKIDNTPNQEVIDNLTRLCVEVLDPIREQFGVVTVTSGYRCKALNLAVKGSKTSAHIRGCAADIKLSVDLLEVAKWIAQSDLQFDQLILEAWDWKARQAGWIHISLEESGNRRQILTMQKSLGKTVYTEDLPD